MISKTNPILSILLILAMLFSFTAVITPAAPVQAAATATVTSPTNASPLYIAQGGTVTVTFNITDNTSPSFTCQAFMVQGTTSYSSGQYSMSGSSPHTLDIYTPLGALAGYYNVYVVADAVASVVQSNAVYIDTVKPTASVNLSSNCWGLTAEPTITWTANKSNLPSQQLYIDVWVGLNGGATWPYHLVDHALYGQGTNSIIYDVSDNFSASATNVVVYVKATDQSGNVSENISTISSAVTIIDPTNLYAANVSPTTSVTWNGNSVQIIGGTIYAMGSTVNYKLDLSTDGGATWPIPITSGYKAAALSTGQYTLSENWTVSNDVVSTACVIRLSMRDCAGNEATATSHSFTIANVIPPRVRVVYPLHARAEKWYVSPTNGSTDNVTFYITSNVSNTFTYSISYASDNATLVSGGGTVMATGSATAGQNVAYWTIPTSVATGTYYLKVRVTDTSANVGDAYSSFKVVSLSAPPQVTLIYPVGGETLNGGTTTTITWTCKEPYDASTPMTFKLYLLNNGSVVNYMGSTDGSFATLVNRPTSSTANTSTSFTYNWSIYNTTGSQYKITVTAIDPVGQSASSTSTNVFAINAGCETENFTINLYPGWNQISLPLLPVSTDINNVLAGISDSSKINSAFFYNSGTWYSYVPGVTSGFSTMDAGRSYWINVKGTPGTTSSPASAACTLTIIGRKCACNATTPNLVSYSTTGWNAVGFKSTIASSPTDYFHTCGGNPIALPIFYYDGPTQTSKSNSSCSAAWLTPGQGYWIYLNSSLGLLLPCQ